MLFLGDTLGPSSVYGGSPETAIRAGMQFPSGDPSVLISAMASVTEHLGFVMTSSVIQAHPFEFARRMSTLDHLTDGRIGWNVVTSYIKMVASEFGLDELPQHDARYRWADEYLAACYALWESSWEDGAVLSDAERNILFDPEKVHSIHHRGERYRIDGPHCMEPSAADPFICQAGSPSRADRSPAGTPRGIHRATVAGDRREGRRRSASSCGRRWARALVRPGAGRVLPDHRQHRGGGQAAPTRAPRATRSTRTARVLQRTVQHRSLAPRSERDHRGTAGGRRSGECRDAHASDAFHR